MLDDKLNKLSVNLQAVKSEIKQPKVSNNVNGLYATRPRLNDGGQFPYGMQASGQTVVLDHQLLRSNGRDAYHDSDLGKAIVDRQADLAVEAGLKLFPTPKISVLGISKERAAKWARALMDRFDLWARSNDCSLEGNQNFYQKQYMMMTSEARDGEYFIRLHYNNDPRLISPLQLQFVDPGLIQGYAYTTTDGYQYPFEDGIERDERGREIAYHFQRWSKSKKQYVDQRIPKYSKSGLLMMIHGFSVKYPGQYRGYSEIGQSVQLLEDITTLKSSQIHKAINQAGIVLSVRPSKDAPATNPGFAIDSTKYSGIRTETDENDETPIVDPCSGFGYQEYPQARFSQPGSTMVLGMQAGQSLEPFKDTGDHEQFDIFVNALVSYMAAGSGMSIETLLMKFGQNYSASIAAIEMSYRVAKRKRMNLETDALNPIVEAFTTVDIARGNMRAPGWLDPVRKAAWLSNRWVGAPRIQIDRAKEATANRANIEMGLTTISDAALEGNGSNALSNMERLDQEFQALPTAPWLPSVESADDTGSDE